MTQQVVIPGFKPRCEVMCQSSEQHGEENGAWRVLLSHGLVHAGASCSCSMDVHDGDPDPLSPP
eukprot:1162147-Pelagomonas_calceolata.AAC.5